MPDEIRICPAEKFNCTKYCLIGVLFSITLDTPLEIGTREYGFIDVGVLKIRTDCAGIDSPGVGNLHPNEYIRPVCTAETSVLWFLRSEMTVGPIRVSDYQSVIQLFLQYPAHCWRRVIDGLDWQSLTVMIVRDF